MIFLDERITDRRADRQTEKSNRDAKLHLKPFYGLNETMDRLMDGRTNGWTNKQTD